MRSPDLGGRDLARAPAPALDEPVVASVRLPDGRAARQATLRFWPRRELGQERDPRPRLEVTLVVARATDEIRATIDRVTAALVGVGAAAMLLCLGIAFAVVRYGLAPVRALATAISEIREDELGGQLDAAAAPGELRPVVERLDELLRRLAAAFARERELTAEVAHELRTPLGGLRATLEVALARDDRPAEKYRAALVECLEIVRHTERLVESLLSLARLDAGVVTVAAEPVALDALVREVLAPQARRAAARGVQVREALAPVEVTTDREKLRVVLQNLLDNAVSYVDEGGAISVELSGRTLQVRNTGCLLTPEQAARVFEVFWRADAARSGAHSGLGLALSRKLMQLLGGALTVHVSGDTFVATVKLGGTA
jgi:signal transduction histidine kinase